MAEQRFGQGQWARLNAYGPGTCQTLYEDCPVFRAMCDAAGVATILASLQASAQPRYVVGDRVEVEFEDGWYAGEIPEDGVYCTCARNSYDVRLDGYKSPSAGQSTKVKVADLRPEGIELAASHHMRIEPTMAAAKMTIGALFRLVHRWLLRDREKGYDAAGVEAVRAKCAQGAKGLLLLELCRCATREERAAMGERVKASDLPVHTFFKEMHERAKMGDGANMIPEGHTLQLEFFQQNDEVFPDSGVEGVTEMRWDDIYKPNYQARPVTKAIIDFYEQRFKQPCPQPLLYLCYSHFVTREAAGLFWGFGFRFTLRDASGKAVKLSNLDVAAFKGLTLDEAPFGRIP